MQRFALAFASWCHEHDLPLDKIELHIRAEDVQTLSRVDTQISRDFDRMMQRPSRLTLGGVRDLTVSGVRIKLRKKDPHE